MTGMFINPRDRASGTARLAQPPTGASRRDDESRSCVAFPPRLLFVEDDPLVGASLRRYFRSFAPELVVSVRAALELLGRTPRFVGAIIDIGLPDGSGLTVLRVLRDRDPHVPVLVLTAYDDHAIISAAQALGATYLVKPARTENLGAFRRQVEAHRATGEAALHRGLEEFANRHALTPCERRVLQLAVDCVPRELYAEALAVSESTVKTQVRSLIGKCPPAEDAPGVARIALRWILLGPR